MVLTDLHVGSPYNGLDKLRRVVERANEESPDLIVLLGDYVIQDVVGGSFVGPEEIAAQLGALRAPLGVFALILSLTAHTGIRMAGAVGFYIAVYSVACILITLLLYPVVTMFTGVPIRLYARAALPAQLIGFSSSSSLAAANRRRIASSRSSYGM